ncbi:hypothetical protein MtrunA17_Chr2g0304031 [Medicago truncatula]|nr:hypothetical protein MtrunA17_Chr2g0304031 [Medicago truncatula]
MLKKMQESDETSFTQNTVDPLNSPVSLPPVLSTGTNQFGEVEKLDDVMAEPRELTGQLGELEEELNNFVAKPNQEWLAKLDGIGEMDFTQNTAHTQSMAKEIFYPSNSNQFEGMNDGFSQWQPIYDPLKSTVRLPSVLSANQLDEPGEWTDQEWFTEFLNVDDQAASKLDDDGDDDIMKWTSQDDGDELIKLISQDDVLAWKDDSFLSQNEEQYATLKE